MLRYWKEIIFNYLILFSVSFAPQDALCERIEASPLLLSKYSLEEIYKPDTYCPNHILCDKYFEDNKKHIGNITICGQKKIWLKRLKQKEKKNIVDTYNNFRDILASGAYQVKRGPFKFPNAADMMQLQWDDDLEEEARRFLGICADKFVNQNITAFGINKDSFVADVYPTHNASEIEEHSFQSDTFKEIFEDAKNFDLSMIRNYTFDERFDMFTVAAFANSRYIGCARIQQYWKDLAPFDACFLMPSEKRLYSQPSYNRLYREGKPCSLCPFGSNCSSEYTNLCHGVSRERSVRHCSLNSKRILCREWDFPEDNLNNCDSKWRVYLEPEDVENILKSYNKFREVVATNKTLIRAYNDSSPVVLKLEWDRELQVVAERILYNCLNVDVISGEKLSFGSHEESPVTAFHLSHNGSSFREELMKAFYEEVIILKATKNLEMQEYKAELTSLVFSKAGYIGCARMTPSITPNDSSKLSEVCIFGPTVKQEKDFATFYPDIVNSIQTSTEQKEETFQSSNPRTHPPEVSSSQSEVSLSRTTPRSSKKSSSEDSEKGIQVFISTTKQGPSVKKFGTLDTGTSLEVLVGLLIFAFSTFLGISLGY